MHVRLDFQIYPLNGKKSTCQKAFATSSGPGWLQALFIFSKLANTYIATICMGVWSIQVLVSAAYDHRIGNPEFLFSCHTPHSIHPREKVTIAQEGGTPGKWRFGLEYLLLVFWTHLGRFLTIFQKKAFITIGYSCQPNTMQ